jgi:acyl-CoA reductase-like NAD-dependent aldehyde dehydrogenase
VGCELGGKSAAIVEPGADLLRDALTAAVSAMPIGDPHDPATASGPLISELQRDRVEGYVASARANSSEGYPTLMLTTS